MERKRIKDLSIVPGVMKTGPKNKVIDMPGVLVGHRTVRNGDNRAGVTVIVSGSGNVFERRFIAAGYMYNGLGKIHDLVQVEELGTLETPIALINTLNAGLAADALVEYTIRQCEKNQVEVISVSPVVSECNDCRISRTQHRAVSTEDVMEVFPGTGEDSEEGDVGVGTGTACYGLEGRIGSAFGVMRIGGVNYTLGVLVQFNFGATEDLVIDGIQAGQWILEEKKRRRKMATAEQDQGSIMTITTTDPSVSDCRLKRIIRRTGVGIARTGVYTGHGSGEVMTEFTTTGHLQGKDSPEIMISTCIREDLINVASKAVAEAVNEAILNFMTVAGRTGGLAGEVYYSLSELPPQIPKH